MKPACSFRASSVQMRKQHFLCFVDDGLDLTDRQPSLFRQWLEAYAVNEPALENRSVPLRMDVLIDQGSDLAIGVLHPAPPKWECC